MLGGTRAFLAIVFAAILFGMTACGSTPAGVKEEGAKEREKAERPPTPMETVRLAYETTAKAESSKFSTRSVITGLPRQEGMPQSLTIIGEGSGTLDGERAQMTVQMPMFGEMEVRYVDSTMYQKMPEPFTAQAPPGKRWVEIDQEKLMEEYGTSLSEMQEGTQGTPSDQLAYLRGVSDSVEKLGTEEVRGAPTTHYRADVDLDKAAPKDPEARRAFERMTEDLRAEKIPTEVWIDEEGRVRRYEMTMAMPLPEGTPQNGQGDPTMTMTAEYYDFGTPVNVEPPPKDKTISFEKLMELQRQQQQSPQRQQTFKS